MDKLLDEIGGASHRLWFYTTGTTPRNRLYFSLYSD